MSHVSEPTATLTSVFRKKGTSVSWSKLEDPDGFYQLRASAKFRGNGINNEAQQCVASHIPT